MDFEIRILGHVDGKAELPEDLIQRIHKVLPARIVPTEFFVIGIVANQKEEDASGVKMLTGVKYSTEQHIKVLEAPDESRIQM